MMGRKRVIPGQSKRVIPGHARKEEIYNCT
jgi:hypothetical protein